ncbi:Aste57867_12797 [Aphanomyces stellatus]|uniref:Aste57867_12797 protein n=1 Tax=Aphanomyces stellatus TaxID=120398 RepID=A0A485KYI8_9STRA|nr:hypothetical protein As57867_012749 [Aphanomyces stellatus]VFT89646.1 Aste57867_12797 [Aphanomyces stellatus]
MGQEAGMKLTASALHEFHDSQMHVSVDSMYLLRIAAVDIKFKHRIGSGAFADVWLARFDDSDVAVKTLHCRRRTVAQVQSFVDEIQLHASFGSPYIVHFIGAAWTSLSDLSLVMEYMDGGDLREYLRSVPVDAVGWDRKLSIIHDVAEGLVYLHSLNIMHRDIKSSNVLLKASTLRSKLFDFGISKEDVEATMTSGVGTFRWMAPEVIQDSIYTLSVDIYSFGVLLSELTTHKLPYANVQHDGEPISDARIMLEVASGALCPTFAKTDPEWLVRLAHQCLAHDPVDRPSATQIIYRVRNVMRDISYPQTRVVRYANDPATADPATPPFGSLQIDRGVDDEEHRRDFNMRDLELYRINSIERTKIIASGAYADIWLAIYNGNNVALKAVDTKRYSLQRFIAEIQLHASLDNPYIVRFIGAAWTRPADVSLVMEYMNGGDLCDYLGAFSVDALGWDKKLSIIRDVAEGLVYLHARNILHRDIKSRNVLLDAATLQGKLCDFSISREDESATLTCGVGTYRWMAPEVLQDSHYTLSADIYSFGALLSELSTHTIPFVGVKDGPRERPISALKIMYGVMRGNLCLTMEPTSPEWLKQLANQCLSRDASDRPTALQILQTVRNVKRECAPLHIQGNNPSRAKTNNAVDLTTLKPFRLAVDDLTITRPLGRGRSMEVFVANFRDQPVAVKHLLVAKKTSDHAVEKFVQEIQLHITATSPFIVAFVGVAWTTPSDLMLVTELMDGDLRTFLETSPVNAVDWTLKFKCAYDIASALAYLHTLRPRIIHRDIKSRNVLVRTASLECKLADLGASREFDGDIQTLTAGVGTFRWMAPEVFQDTHYDTWADMYSFGVLLSELATHEIPYEGLTNDRGAPMSEMAIMARVMNGTLKPEFTPDTPSWFVELAMKCLALEPAVRPTAIQVAHLIKQKMDNQDSGGDFGLQQANAPPSVQNPATAMAQLFDDHMFFKLAQCPATMHLLADFELVTKLQAIQNCVHKTSDLASDPRMAPVFVALASTQPSTDAVARAFGPDMISKVASNPITVQFLTDSSFYLKLTSVQQDVSKLPLYMDDWRMGIVLTELLRDALALDTPTFDTLDALVAYIGHEKGKQWPLINYFVLCSDVIATSNHSIFRAENTRKRHQAWVAKLSDQRHELDFFDAIYKLGPDDVARATRHFVQCEEWGEVKVLSYKCFAVVMERGSANCAERLPRLQANDFLRFSCLKEILDAIRVVHELGYIHGDIKLENVVYFGDEAGYKLIDFDNSARPGDLWAKHCTEEYCPPEMAKFMLGHTNDLIASSAFDVWCAAVLVLKLFVRQGHLLEFLAIDNEDLLKEIAKPGFSFQASIAAADLSERKKEWLAKCLDVDPTTRGTLDDLARLAPSLKTTTKGSELTDLYKTRNILEPSCSSGGSL